MNLALRLLWFAAIGTGLLRADPPSPGGGNNGTEPLNFWSLSDTNNWLSGYGYSPLGFSNIVGQDFRDDGDDNALVIDSINPAWSRADQNVLSLLQQAGSPQRTSLIVPETGLQFTFKSSP
jgi:hypothetical protein